MDARRYLARELKKRGFTFTPLKQPSPCLKEMDAESVRYAGWAAELIWECGHAFATQLVHVVDRFSPSPERADTQYMIRAISVDAIVGKTPASHECYHVTAEVGGNNIFCPRNVVYLMLKDINAGTGYCEPERKNAMMEAKPTKDLVARVLKSVDSTTQYCRELKP